MKILFSFILLFPIMLNAQNIVNGEFFWDHDPGIGQGIHLPVNSPDDSVDFSLSINTTGLLPGAHIFGFRTKNINGIWSHTVTNSFNIIDGPDNNPSKIVALEYFFDTDPGPGNGTPLELPIKSDSIVSTLQLINPFDSGVHKLVVRSLNEQGLWSHQYAKEFAVCSIYGAVADFDFFVDRKTVYFTNNSIYDTSFTWKFGDGNIDIKGRNPKHVYEQAGLFNVCLEARNTCAINKLCRQIIVNGLQSVYPAYSANKNRILVHIRGVGFKQGATVELKNQGFSIYPDTVIFISSTDLKVNFNFDGEPRGKYDLVLTNPSEIPDTLHNAFELQSPVSPHLQLIHSGTTRTRANSKAHNSFSVTNSGNMTAFMIPFFIIFPEGSLDYIYPSPDFFIDPSVDLGSLPPIPPKNAYDFDNPWDPDGPPYKIIAGILPWLGPGETAEFPLDVHSPVTQCTELNVIVGEPLADDFINPFTNSCTFLPDAMQCAMDLVGLFPVVGCATGAANFGCTIGNEINDQWGGTDKIKWYDHVANTAGMLLSCFGEFGQGIYGFAAEIAGFSSGISGFFSDCQRALHSDTQQDNYKKVIVCHSTAWDPNMKIGPSGINENNYINSEQVLDYMVLFENLASATAPAAEVVITDQLDTALLDLSTFRINSMGFGDSVIYAEEEVTGEWVTEIDLKKEKNILLRVHAWLDTTSGILTWKFRSFDTLSMDLVTDPELGFLPPNVNSPEGEGFISYSVYLKPGLAHGTTIGNSASIVFDYNDPIITNTWINTIDTEKPVSEILPLPEIVRDTIITLRMMGEDPDAGVRAYNIYYSVNDSDFKILALGVWEDSLKFKGKEGNKYAFFSQAIDNADNIENIVNKTGVFTEIRSPATRVPKLNLSYGMKVTPNPVYDHVLLTFEISAETLPIYIDMMDVNGRKLISGYEIKGENYTLSLKSCEPGIYIIRATEATTGKLIGVVRIMKL